MHSTLHFIRTRRVLNLMLYWWPKNINLSAMMLSIVPWPFLCTPLDFIIFQCNMISWQVNAWCVHCNMAEGLESGICRIKGCVFRGIYLLFIFNWRHIACLTSSQKRRTHCILYDTLFSPGVYDKLYKLCTNTQVTGYSVVILPKVVWPSIFDRIWVIRVFLFIHGH